jgi:hypothetical protein
MSALSGDVDTDYVIRRGGELRSMAHIRQGGANAAEKVALLAVQVAGDLDRCVDQDDALALAAVLGEPYVIHSEPRNGAVL